MKIIQILIGPATSSWQSNLMGLGDNGCVYVAEHDGWRLIQDTKIKDPSFENTPETLPEKLYRKDDNEVFVLLPEEELYIMEKNEMANPYKYSYQQLMETNSFSDIPISDIPISKNKRNK